MCPPCGCGIVLFGLCISVFVVFLMLFVPAYEDLAKHILIYIVSIVTVVT